SSTYPVGTLALLERNATITGIVADGDPVSDIPVIAWRPDAPGGAHTRSGTDGDYVLSVVEGTWLVKPAPGPDQPWLYAGRPTEVEVPDAGTVTDVNFLLTPTDAEIVGTLVDESGTIVTDVEGWVHAANTADPAVQKGAPVEDGAFTVLVPAGTYNVGLRLPAGAEYIAPVAKDASVSSGGSATVTFELREKNSKIAGALWERRDEVVVTGVDATVTAFSEGAWLRTTVHPGNGVYTMSVASGIWTLGYRVDPTSNYVALRHRRNYPVEDHQTIPVPLPVAEKDGLISGTVHDPDGTGLGGAMVIADGLGQGLGDVTLRTLSRPDGTFELAVPHGHYVLRATLGADSGWINPVSLRIYVPPDGSVSGRELQFLEPDATISGAVDISGTHSYTGTVHLWAWSPSDGYTKATTSLGGDYVMNVISNTTWHVGAAFQTTSQYWIAYARVPVPEGGATQDLTLRGPFSLPAPVTVSFDANEEQYVELADGTSIYIPAGAMPVSGTVTLHVTPIATFPHQRHANVYRYGYAFTATDSNGQPIEQQFNHDVLITFSYNKAELIRMGISERWLKPAYFSTTTDSWTFPEGYVVDTVANVVAMQIDHFTGFALTGEAGQQVFLPLVLR
ncbi:MAG: carboxypeptidase-like regulatory domain-containing protein, partial [Candidatus Hodarchaeales archaeon]